MRLVEPIDTFWCEPNGLARVSLRRFTMGDYPDGRYADDLDRSSRRMCAAAEPYNGYVAGCRAVAIVFDVAPERRNDEGFLVVWAPDEFDGNPAWPTACEACGEAFSDDDGRAVNQEPWYVSPGRGQWTIADLPAGAMYDATWHHDKYRGPSSWCGDDGISLMVVCPPGAALHAHWCVDGPANNCTRKDEPHRCWCRTGDPRAANVTVGKDCDTCSAGAGSIQTADWHGFLRSGALLDA